MKKEIDISLIIKTVKKTRKIAWWMGEHIFFSIMIMVVIGIILGYVIFYRSIVSTDRLLSQTDPVILFRENNYQEAKNEWAENERRRNLIDRKIYINPFDERSAIVDPIDNGEDIIIEEEEEVIEGPIISDEFIVHTVVSGDNLWILAERYLGSGFRWVEITDLDDSPYPDWRADVLRINEQLKIPTK